MKLKSTTKTILIIFPDQWIAYSPSILNLVDALKTNYSVHVTCINTNEFDHSMLDTTIYSYVTIPKIFAKFARKCRVYYSCKLIILLLATFRKKYDFVFGIDSIGALVAQLLFNSYFYYSLEARKDFYFKLLNISKIKALIIQTEERKNYLFGECDVKTVLIQNAPVFTGTHTKQPTNRLVYFGNICKQHGVIEYIKVIEKNSHYTLTLKGTIEPFLKARMLILYRELLDTHRLIIDESYTPQNEVVPFLRAFSIGFCFYDFSLIDKNDYNYLSCPSGKMFNYFAAGVPVLGQDIVGLQSVKTFNAGILLKEMSPEKILEGLREIYRNYNLLVEGCFRAAAYFDFSKSVEALKQYLNA